MFDFLAHLFDPSGFPPRWHCGDWSAPHGWLHIVSDLGVWSAYFTIPAMLVWFTLRRTDLPFKRIFWLFGAFILACGTTHLMEAIIFWWPVYRLAGVIKLLTALVSWGTVVALVPIVPQALALRSPRELEREIAERRRAEEDLRKLHAELETRVAQRTAELAHANEQLQSEIAERKRTEVSLHEQREWFRVTLSSIGDAVIATDPVGIVTFMNTCAQQHTGWDADKAVGQPLNTVFHIINEYTRAPVENPVDIVMKTNVLCGLANHTLLVSRDGRETPIDDTAAPIRDDQGKVLGAVLVFHEITERRRAEETLRESEERTRSIVDHVIDGIISIDAAGSIQTMNRAAERLFGHAAQEVIGQNVKLLMPDPYHGQHDQYVQNYLTTGEAKVIGIGREVVGRRKDGSTFPMDLAISEFQLGQRRFFTGIVRDITERKRTEKQLRDADRRKDEFLAMLAHELRNPLAPIRSGLDLLSLQGVEGETIRLMQQQVHHMVRLVDDLLDVSRIMHGRIDLRPEPVQVAVIVAHAVETVRSLIDAQRHELNVSLPAEPVWVHADPVRLSQVLANLLNNAAKYTEPGGHISVTGQREQDQVVIRVRDNGVGIDAELLPHIFELFTQADRSLERSQGGLGIGLTLVRNLVEMHGGSIFAHSAGPGQGTEMVVWLDAIAPPTDGDTDIELSEDAAHGASPSPLRVLVVDDTTGSATILAALLKKLFLLDARTATDGPAALALAQEFLPQIIFLDIGLPGMSGYDVARKLREQPQFRETLLVALTGYGADEDRRRSHEAGFDEHLVKPASAEVLRQVLRHAKIAALGRPAS